MGGRELLTTANFCPVGNDLSAAFGSELKCSGLRQLLRVRGGGSGFHAWPMKLGRKGRNWKRGGEMIWLPKNFMWPPQALVAVGMLRSRLFKDGRISRGHATGVAGGTAAAIFLGVRFLAEEEEACK